MLTLFSVIWSQIRCLVIIDYSLGKKHTVYAVTQPERELLSNWYGSRTMLPTLYCVSQKERVREVNGHIVKCDHHICTFIFDLICLLPWAVCVKISCESIKWFWRCGFEHGHKENSEFRTFAGWHWFRKIPCGDFYSIMSYSKAVGRK